MELWPHQIRAIDALRRSVAAKNRRICLTIPTGGGKTKIASAITSSAASKGKSVLFLAPRRELIYQAYERFSADGIDSGIIMAGEGRRLYATTQIASFDTLSARGMRSKRMDMPRADIIIRDETHITGGSRDAIADFYSAQGALVIGLTATPTLSNGRGLGALYDDLVSVVSVRELIDGGYLAQPRYFAPSKPDLENIRRNEDGDYQERALGRVMDTPKLCGDIVDNWLRIAADRSSVVFCVTRAHSRHVCEEFVAAGIRAEHVDGETPNKDRKEILARVESGETQVLCNVFVASYGLDIPRLGCAVLARPTRSLALYFQTCGRVLRAFPGKQDAIVIDHAGAFELHGKLEDEQPWLLDQTDSILDRKERMKKESSAPKEIICSQCSCGFSGSRTCPNCGHAMVPRTEKIPVHEADLEEVGAKAGPTLDEKVEFMAGLKWYASEKNKPATWCRETWTAKFKESPPAEVCKAEPKPYNQAVKGFIVHRNIRFAKSRRFAA